MRQKKLNPKAAVGAAKGSQETGTDQSTSSCDYPAWRQTLQRRLAGSRLQSISMGAADAMALSHWLGLS
jgi:hypothetical protein